MFTLVRPSKITAESTVDSWKQSFDSKKKKNKTYANASSIADQILSALSERHAYILFANLDNRCCSILIADDLPDGIQIRFLLRNICDPNSKGSGTFLVNHILNFKKNVKTVAQNSEKYWLNLGFRVNKDDETQLTYRPVSDTENSGKHSKKHNRK
ncbi:putative uncharacterized protein [Waddlia chondrophila 2032/99]|uniref:N-acetyltransferase domain-containing protein n=2 Tax=Waddlia chondrophila TaxID=71667 RepID=D6YUN2_WADCW|nr:hypothetical protein [Waddlia chondrophila]ADI37843.1 hypothetical protein wcw_0472 [Waddlia chondrophila WSU 86-1044]CCB92008.1 putative uncharacterized protein [Waddlia chondrophila 2032/99]